MQKIHLKRTLKAFAATLLISTSGGFAYQTYKLNELDKEHTKLTEQSDKQINLLSKNARLIDKLNKKINVKQNEINKLNETIAAKNTEIYQLKDQLEKAKKRNESPQSKPVTVSRGKEKVRQSATKYTVTAYTAGVESTGKKPGDKGYGVTASGEIVKEGVTIACPPELDFGTKVHIESVGYRVCQDRGGAIKNRKLDLYVSDLSTAKQFGRQKLDVKILN